MKPQMAAAQRWKAIVGPVARMVFYAFLPSAATAWTRTPWWTVTGATVEELRRVITRAWNPENECDARDLLPRGTSDTQLQAYDAERRNGL